MKLNYAQYHGVCDAHANNDKEKSCVHCCTVVSVFYDLARDGRIKKEQDEAILFVNAINKEIEHQHPDLIKSLLIEYYRNYRKFTILVSAEEKCGSCENKKCYTQTRADCNIHALCKTCQENNQTICSYCHNHKCQQCSNTKILIMTDCGHSFCFECLQVLETCPYCKNTISYESIREIVCRFPAFLSSLLSYIN